MIAMTLRINKMTPIVIRFVSLTLIINNTGIIRLLENILNDIAAIEDLRILLRL